MLVPPWVTIEFGPSPAFSQPNPGCPFGFHHTLRSPELCTRPRCLSSHSDLRRPASLLIHPDPTPSSHSAQLLCSALFFLLTRLTAYAILRRQIQITAGQTWSDARLEHQLRHHQQPRQHAQSTRSTTHLFPGCSSISEIVHSLCCHPTPITSNKKIRRVRRPARPPLRSFDHHGFPRPRSL